jgi:ArsR family metal-binding transcriptional regulator
MKKEINHAWEIRDTITPSYEGLPRPNIVEILKCLPKTNCRQCSSTTCMVFATRVADGIKAAEDCTEITAQA